MPEVNDPLPNGFWRFQPHHSHHDFRNWNYAVLFLINVCCHVNSVLYKLKHLSTSQLHLLLRRKLKQWKKLVCAPGNWHFTSTSPYYIANKEGQPFRSRQTRAILAWHEQYTWSAMIQRAGTHWVHISGTTVSPWKNCPHPTCANMDISWQSTQSWLP